MLRQGFAMPASSLSRVQDVRLNKYKGTRFALVSACQAQQKRLQVGLSPFQDPQGLKWQERLQAQAPIIRYQTYSELSTGKVCGNKTTCVVLFPQPSFYCNKQVVRN